MLEAATLYSACTISFEATPLKVVEAMECAGSHLRGSCTGPATLRCGICGAVRYCSQQHQKRHWREHAISCSRMAEQMKRAPELYDFPFTFPTDHSTSCCPLLKSRNLHGATMWNALCSCFDQLPLTGDWELPASSCPCKPPEDSPPPLLQSWAAYYNWRGIPLDSPVALLLHWPLTLYHAISISQIRNPNSLHIHYLGPERELDQLMTFTELLALFPGVSFHIDFVGPGVSELRDAEEYELSGFACCSDVECDCMERKKTEDQVTMKLWRGLYHDKYAELGNAPDLIFAGNAGLAACTSWHVTLQLIESLDVPAIFTDYCEEAAVMAVETIRYVSQRQQQHLAFPVQVNPFRQPLSRPIDLDLPTFSNAFVFGIRGRPDSPRSVSFNCLEIEEIKTDG